MTTPYVDPVSVHTPTTGTSPPALWGTTVRNDLEFLVKPPGCVVQTSTPQNTTSAVWFNLSWNGTDLRDTDSFHTGTSDVITIPTGLGGWYNISGSVVFDPSATGVRAARYSINGAGDYRFCVVPAAAGLGTRLPISQDVLLSAGDLLRISVYQNSGGVLASPAGSIVSVRLVAQA